MIVTFHGFILLIVANQYTVVTQVVTQGIGNFIIQERQQATARVDQVYLHTQSSKDGGVFRTNDTGTVDNQGTRGVGQIQNGV